LIPVSRVGGWHIEINFLLYEKEARFINGSDQCFYGSIGCEYLGSGIALTAGFNQ
jgi:hypothetical protein